MFDNPFVFILYKSKNNHNHNNNICLISKKINSNKWFKKSLIQFIFELKETCALAKYKLGHKMKRHIAYHNVFSKLYDNY